MKTTLWNPGNSSINLTLSKQVDDSFELGFSGLDIHRFQEATVQTDDDESKETKRKHGSVASSIKYHLQYPPRNYCATS